MERGVRSHPGLTAQAPIIRACGVCKSHRLTNGESVQALDNIDLCVAEREFLTLVGPSGCGKSTLLALLAGLSRPDSGEIVLDGRLGGLARPSLGYISQRDSLLPWRTVLGNVELGLELRAVPRKKRREQARSLLDQVGLAGFEHSYPFELSGGMRKRVAVVRSLAYGPDILFMDEPFVGLDVQTRDALEEDILKLWHRRQKTIVLVTHDLSEAITLSDRIVLLTARPGRVKAEYLVDLPRPRSVVEVRFTDAFVALHRTIWRALSVEVQHGAQGRGHDEHAA